MSQDKGRKNPTGRKKALGRGLAALLGDQTPDQVLEAGPRDRIINLPLERLEPNPYQPRRDYDPEALATLADSIAEHGVLQPLVVRPVEHGYQLIAGERRLRASQMAGLATVPVVVRQASDQLALLLALLENLQREDLNALEEARAYQRLAGEFSLSQEQIAGGLGRDRSTIANTLRLLKLPAEIQSDVASGRISAGHGRALLSLENPAQMRKARDEIVSRHLSVRAAERLVKTMSRKPAPAKKPSQAEIHLASLSEDMERKLGARVDINRKGKKGGSIIIKFADDEELNRIIGILG